MNNKPESDPLRLAMEFSCFTSRSLFVTGRAGTGKTTFLSAVRERSRKKMIVVAPTGIAAVNASGVTIHSFFQFPSVLLNEEFFKEAFPVYDADKRNLIRGLELLIIDEISMVRADVMDAIDRVLRHYRGTLSVPFGGVQLLMLGDLFQLPPVVDDRSGGAFNRVYSTPFFFSSRSVRELDYLVIELSQVFRQADDRFVALLSAIRTNSISEADMHLLNERCFKNGKVPADAVFLTTHRTTADDLNSAALDKLEGSVVELEAVIEGEFPGSLDPSPRCLRLKPGAQIIFTKNDASEENEYYNGKAGVIKEIGSDRLMIAINNDRIIELERSAWVNRGLKADPLTGTIGWVELGVFRQYPVRLAWAVTIHKCQGMTFDKAVIDARNAFAPGQVYVALSRLRTLDGLFLKAPLTAESIQTDSRVVDFFARAIDRQATAQELVVANTQFRHAQVIRLMQLDRCAEIIQDFVDGHKELAIAGPWAAAIGPLRDVAARFERQLTSLFELAGLDRYESVLTRIELAVQYFMTQISGQLIAPLHVFAETLTNVRKNEVLIRELNDLLNVLEMKKGQYQTGLLVARALADGVDTARLVNMVDQQQEEVFLLELKVKAAPPKEKGPTTQQKTLVMFQKGFGLEEIAQKRKIPIGVVEDHLVSFILSGEIRLDQLVTREKLARIAAMQDEHPDWSVHQLKYALGQDISFGEIRAVLAGM